MCNYGKPKAPSCHRLYMASSRVPQTTGLLPSTLAKEGSHETNVGFNQGATLAIPTTEVLVITRSLTRSSFLSAGVAAMLHNRRAMSLSTTP
mmetsp:Transcript_58824/g.137384  ORF Transcript_58824/g.137384 Transcript_58824/m.137384 type:complete len:92 (+) Transcript_58824:10-285(+)